MYKQKLRPEYQMKSCIKVSDRRYTSSVVSTEVLQVSCGSFLVLAKCLLQILRDVYCTQEIIKNLSVMSTSLTKQHRAAGL